MRTGRSSNALLVELLIVIAFFMLSATILMQVFAGARTQSDRAERIALAVQEAQNTADRLLAAEEPEAALREMGFEASEGGWSRTEEGYRLTVTGGADALDYGSLRRLTVRAEASDGEALLTLPVVRYEEK